MHSTVVSRARPSRTLLGVVGLCAGLWVAPPAAAQTIPFTNINPRNSTLDPSDPDGASGGRRRC